MISCPRTDCWSKRKDAPVNVFREMSKLTTTSLPIFEKGDNAETYNYGPNMSSRSGSITPTNTHSFAAVSPRDNQDGGEHRPGSEVDEHVDEGGDIYQSILS